MCVGFFAQEHTLQSNQDPHYDLGEISYSVRCPYDEVRIISDEVILCFPDDKLRRIEKRLGKGVLLLDQVYKT